MENLISFFNGFNVQTILSMIAVLWYFTRDIRNEIRKEIESIRQELDVIRKENAVQAKRSDRLYEMFIDLLKEKMRDK